MQMPELELTVSGTNCTSARISMQSFLPRGDFAIASQSIELVQTNFQYIHF